MTSRGLAVLVGCNERYVQRLTQKATLQNLPFIIIDDVKYPFCIESTRYGKSYNYTTLTTPTTLKGKEYRISALRVEDLETISHIDIRESKITPKDKYLVVALYKKSNYSLYAIVKCLCLENGHIPTKKEVLSYSKRLRRWVKAFEKDGKKGLIDNRGAKAGEFKKIDEELLRKVIIGVKAKSSRDGFEKVHQFYAYLVGKQKGILESNPQKIVAYSSIISATKTLFKKDGIFKAFMTKGWDGVLQSYPVGVRDISYPNQEWQVDATKADFMVRKADGTIGRLNYTVAMDTCTGAYVGSLSETITSYDQTALLFEAIKLMGKPEVIRMDNGRDYTSNHYQEFAGILEAGVIFAEVGQGRQKGKVERNFGVIQNALALIPGYIGNDVAKRTLIENQTASKIDIRTSKATRIREDRLLSEAELRTILEQKAREMSKYYEAHSSQVLDASELETLRLMLGKSSERTLQESGITYNNITYTGVALWTFGLKKGDKVLVRENIDDINKLYVYKDGEFVGEVTNRKEDAAMSIAEFKESKKAYKKNHITPLTNEIKEAQKMAEEYQDVLVQATLGKAADYMQNSPKDKKAKAKVSSVVSTSASFGLSDWDDDLYRLAKSVS